MEPVPPYLAWYLLKIRRHSGEVGYLKRRLEARREERAVYEKTMLREMYDLHLVGLSEHEEELAFTPDGEPAPRLAGGTAVGPRHVVGVPKDFVVLARGHYLWMEYVAAGGRWLVTASLGAVIGALVTLLVNGHPFDAH